MKKLSPSVKSYTSALYHASEGGKSNIEQNSTYMDVCFQWPRQLGKRQRRTHSPRLRIQQFTNGSYGTSSECRNGKPNSKAILIVLSEVFFHLQWICLCLDLRNECDSNVNYEVSFILHEYRSNVSMPLQFLFFIISHSAVSRIQNLQFSN